MHIADKVCNLECTKNAGGTVHEFIGPVKIVMTDLPKAEYRSKLCCASLIALANMLMGAITVTVLFYTLSFTLEFFNNLHVFLCTVGYQLFVPSGILMFNSLNGASAPMAMADKKFQHFFLQVFGIGCGITGSILVLLFGDTPGSKFTLHSLVGLASGAFSILSGVSGPGAFFAKEKGFLGDIFRKSHVFFGLPAFLLSSLCFVLGILKPCIRKWAPVWDMINFPIVFCLFYTIIVTYTPLMKLVNCHRVENVV